MVQGSAAPHSAGSQGTADYTFHLPVGLVSPDGHQFQQGGMRLSTALDEIEPLGDARVRANEGYYGLLLLARVVTWLGPYRRITPELIASLAAADFAYLQEVYGALNAAQPAVPPAPWANTQAPAAPQLIETVCPHCQATLELDLSQGVSG